MTKGKHNDDADDDDDDVSCCCHCTDLVSSATASASVLSGSRAFCMYFGASAVTPGIPDNVIYTHNIHRITYLLQSRLL